MAAAPVPPPVEQGRATEHTAGATPRRGREVGTATSRAVRTIWLPSFGVVLVALGVLLPAASTLMLAVVLDGSQAANNPGMSDLEVVSWFVRTLLPAYLIGVILIAIGAGLLAFDAHLRHERVRWQHETPAAPPADR